MLPATERSFLRRWLYRLAWSVPPVVILAASLSGTIMSQVEQPKYKVVELQGDIEIREYAPMIVAEVEVRGERMKALNQGFRLIADYIFGNNLSSKKVPMTAPVTQQAGEKIAMTAPVTQDGSGDSWKIRFVMPENYTLDTLPKPKNQDVRLIATPARRVAVIRFSGFNTDRNISSHREKLLNYIADRRLPVAGEPTTAFYNPLGRFPSCGGTKSWSNCADRQQTCVERTQLVSDSKLILVTGATGYVGGRLVPRLLASGHRVRCLVRDPARLQGRPWRSQVEVVQGDMLQPGTLEAAMRDVEVIYYLVHSLSGGSNFTQQDVVAARHCARAAEAAGVKRIIYLGGLGNAETDLSPHLRSRHETGDALREGKSPSPNFAPRSSSAPAAFPSR